MEELMSDSDIYLAYGLVRIVDAEGRSTRSVGKSPAGWETECFDYLWHTMAAVYCRSALEKAGRWNPNLTMPDDSEFSSHVRIAGSRYRFIDVVVGNLS
jgi:hypothetical protein